MMGGGAHRRHDAEDAVHQHVGGEEQHQGEYRGAWQEQGE